MQEKLFYIQTILHMCINPDCFYHEGVIDWDDIVWKEVWNSEIEDMDCIPLCPSCREVLWRELNV